MASNYLGTALGRRTVQQLARVINQPDVAENALSSAHLLIVESLRIVSVLEAYPTTNIPINVGALASLLRTLTQDYNLQNKLFAGLSGLGGAPTSGPDLKLAGVNGSVAFQQLPFAFAGRVAKSIKSALYLPTTATAESKAPLVVLVPGLNTDMNALLYVGDTLASHGYAVAALNLPFTSADTVTAAIEGTGAIPPANAWYRQPITVSELIDQIKERWGNRVDTKRVGVLGQSLGGYTVTALAGATLDWPHLVQGCRQLDGRTRWCSNRPLSGSAPPQIGWWSNKFPRPTHQSRCRSEPGHQSHLQQWLHVKGRVRC